MSEQAVARNWRAMIRVGHDFYHCWRQALLEELGVEKTEELSLRFWQKVANVTAGAYARAASGEMDLEGLVRVMARSSEIMGEQVRVERHGEDVLLIHEACPWTASYRAYGGGNCRPGCDCWFREVAAAVVPGCSVRTESSLPGGDRECVRRFSLDPGGGSTQPAGDGPGSSGSASADGSPA